MEVVEHPPRPAAAPAPHPFPPPATLTPAQQLKSEQLIQQAEEDRRCMVVINSELVASDEFLPFGSSKTILPTAFRRLGQLFRRELLLTGGQGNLRKGGRGGMMSHGRCRQGRGRCSRDDRVGLGFSRQHERRCRRWPSPLGAVPVFPRTHVGLTCLRMRFLRHWTGTRKRSAPVSSRAYR